MHGIHVLLITLKRHKTSRKTSLIAAHPAGCCGAPGGRGGWKGRRAGPFVQPGPPRAPAPAPRPEPISGGSAPPPPPPARCGAARALVAPGRAAAAAAPPCGCWPPPCCSAPCVQNLTDGDASLVLNSNEATVGNYSCEVTESNREGELRMELRNSSVVSCGDETPEEKCGSWFLLVERAVIVSLVILLVILCAAQLSFIGLKYEIESQRKVCVIVALVIFAVVAGVGAALFIQGGYTVQNQAGLGLMVIPAVILVPLQYVMFGIVFDSQLQATLALIGLKLLGFIIAVVGFALCLPACPPLHGSVLIAGLAIMAIASLLSLAYVFIMGSRMKDHPRPGKAVEEPLNELQSYVMRI
ncbi:leukocyte surface antigen CD47 isoform X2 [Cinclus cinclus]|uniref:leukocyte surface antigen CD47 isoform X2 n=1 Tax=Cinclus cinclus TaxID=127875 RepID=UPI002E0ECEA4